MQSILAEDTQSRLKIGLMMDVSHFFNYFIALLVVANPLSALPAILRITRNQTIAEKKQTGITAAFAILAVLLITTWVGFPLLNLLGIQLPAFQVAGGAVVFMMAFSMLHAEESSLQQSPAEQKLNAQNSGAIVPLAIPIIAGPGAISTIIVQVNEFGDFFSLLLLSAASILVSLIMGIILYSASTLERVLGPSRIHIINRLGGLFLAAIAVQTIANGIIGLFHFSH